MHSESPPSCESRPRDGFFYGVILWPSEYVIGPSAQVIGEVAQPGVRWVMNTTQYTVARISRLVLLPGRALRTMQQVIRRACDCLPSIAPYMGPDSVQMQPGDRRLLIGGKVVILRRRGH